MSSLGISSESAKTCEGVGAVLLHSTISVPLALFRIIYGLCVSATVILLHGDWLDWFGVHRWISTATAAKVEPGVRFNLFALMPQDDRWIAAFFWVFLGFALFLTIGLWTRFSCVAVFLCLVSIQQRNLWMLHGGDAFLRVAGFFLMFAPAGAAIVSGPSDTRSPRAGRACARAESSMGAAHDPVPIGVDVFQPLSGGR